MSDLVLWGASGHGKVVLDVARTMGGFRTISFIDDACEEPGRKFCDCPVSGARQYLDSLGGAVHSRYLVSIGQNVIRARCFGRAIEYGLLPATLIRIAEGSVVMPRVVINASAQVGRNCIINTAAVVEHDCRIGDHVHLSPGVLLGGNVAVAGSADGPASGTVNTDFMVLKMSRSSQPMWTAVLDGGAMAADAASDVMDVVDDRAGLRSTIVTSQLPVGHWHEALGEPTLADAILDRLVHNAHRIELSGESLRRTRTKQPIKA